MSDPIGAFFDRLAGGGYERLLRKTAGTIRFELTGDDGLDLWHLTIVDGRVAVSREARDADAVIRTDRAFFARMARGEAKPLPAWLRNDDHRRGAVPLRRPAGAALRRAAGAPGTRAPWPAIVGSGVKCGSGPGAGRQHLRAQLSTTATSRRAPPTRAASSTSTPGSCRCGG